MPPARPPRRHACGRFPSPSRDPVSVAPLVPLVLASASPRRRELLERLGIAVEVVPADVDERPHEGEAPAQFAARMAHDKAAVVANARTQAWVLAADTIVTIDGRILGKPVDASEARAMLRALAGRTHEVVTAYVLRRGATAAARTVRTAVEVAALDERDIDAYLACGEWQDKAGAYAIQGVFAWAVIRLRGSYTNVVGLPLAEVVSDLRRLGAIPGFPHGFRA